MQSGGGVPLPATATVGKNPPNGVWSLLLAESKAGK